MHPMAVYCTLVGLRPMWHGNSPNPDGPRIRRHASDYEQQLQTLNGNWRIAKGGMLNNYVTTTWEEIPDTYLDKLTYELINELREHH